MGIKRTIVISGINLFEGGPLKVYYDLLDTIVNTNIFKTDNVILFVHKRSLFTKYERFFNIIELPKSRSFFLYRLYYEYIYFFFYSKRRKIDIWISLHDITPNVIAKCRYVYCHNPCLFDPNLKKITFYNWKEAMYARLYKCLYGFHIKQNTCVITQSNWMAEEFSKMFNINNFIVSRPEVQATLKNDNFINGEGYRFFYPALPRHFKNFELICEAVEYVVNNKVEDFIVYLTIDGSENEYSNNIVKKFGGNKNIKFVGRLSFEQVNEYYKSVDCMIFPSRLETWGLPISEFKSTGKNMLLVDLPYAHETLGEYEKVSFFKCDSSVDLGEKMMACIDGSIIYDGNENVVSKYQMCNGWFELIKYISERCENENKN